MYISLLSSQQPVQGLHDSELQEAATSALAAEKTSPVSKSEVSRPTSVSSDQKPMSRTQKKLQEIEEQNALLYAKKQTNKTMTPMLENIIIHVWKDYLHSIIPDSFAVTFMKILTKKKLGVRIVHQVK